MPVVAAAAARAIADGLKMCDDRPLRRQRTNSLEARAPAISRSWPKKYSGSNHRKRLIPHHRQGAEADPPVPASGPLQEHLHRVEDHDLDRYEREMRLDRRR